MISTATAQIVYACEMFHPSIKKETLLTRLKEEPNDRSYETG